MLSVSYLCGATATSRSAGAQVLISSGDSSTTEKMVKTIQEVSLVLLGKLRFCGACRHVRPAISQIDLDSACKTLKIVVCDAKSTPFL